MPVIIQDMSAEVPAAASHPVQPHEPSTAGEPALALERLRAATLRDAQRQARLWAD